MLPSYRLFLAVLLASMLGGCSPLLAYENKSNVHITQDYKTLALNLSKQTVFNEVVYQTIAMESANQPARGQEAVAGVILERSRRSGKSLEAVCLAPRQFSCWNSQKEAKRWLLKHYDSQTRGKAVKAYSNALMRSGAYRGVRHYHTKGVMPKWAKGHKPALIIGEHVFYRGIK